jgi:SAM-dependent methyltransferase
MNALFDQFLDAANRPFSGWDFSFVSDAGRMVEVPTPWSYTSLLLPYLWQAESMLDMGTGGGEFLSRLQPLPARTAATEGYEPNIPVARDLLEPLGVTVHRVVEDEQLPFADDEFDLIINRHESYAASELMRVLKPGGHFITQQVGGDNDNDLNRLLGASPMTEYDHWTLAYAVDELETAGFEIIYQAEAHMATRFYDIGAVVYYLNAVPWQIEDFSLDLYRDRLLDLHHHIQAHGYVDIAGSRFVVVARPRTV